MRYSHASWSSRRIACRISNKRGVCRQRRPERDRHGVGQARGQPPGVGRAENAPVQPVEVHRDDGSGAPLHDALKAALKRCHQAGSRELSFGKNADDVARVECLSRLSKRLQNHFRPAARGDRDRFHRPEHPADKRFVEVLDVDHEPNGPVDRGDDEQAVGERHVIGDQAARLPPPVRSTGPRRARDKACVPARPSGIAETPGARARATRGSRSRERTKYRGMCRGRRSPHVPAPRPAPSRAACRRRPKRSPPQ